MTLTLDLIPDRFWTWTKVSLDWRLDLDLKKCWTGKMDDFGTNWAFWTFWKFSGKWTNWTNWTKIG